jgi:hypothetical protein
MPRPNGSDEATPHRPIGDWGCERGRSPLLISEQAGGRGRPSPGETRPTRTEPLLHPLFYTHTHELHYMLHITVAVTS